MPSPSPAREYQRTGHFCEARLELARPWNDQHLFRRLSAENGTVRLAAPTAQGTGPTTIFGNASVTAEAAQTNLVVLAGGTLGATPAIASFGHLTASNGTTSTIFTSNPLDFTMNSEMNFTGNLRGGGNIIVASGSFDPNVDGGVGFRLRGTGPSDFSGTLTISNNVKGELQTAVAGPFSPAGTGKIFLVGGQANLDGTVNAPPAGGYSELNIRNNFTNHSFLGNDVELLSSDPTTNNLVTLNPLGTAPTNAISTMGNLKIGDKQELGVIRNTGQPQIVLFQSVTLRGGNSTFSPKTPGFGVPGATGSDLWLGPISQLAPAGITMAGLRTLTLTGTNTYTGPTLVLSGTLALTNNASFSNSVSSPCPTAPFSVSVAAWTAN